jgi:branched-subunit amino acid aminotransferase/4-amino-4-deoxychorismate lyase
MVTEGAATNAWIVDAKGVLRTRPATHEILNGIVRQVLLNCVADLGLKFEETPFSLKEALAAKECFSTASTMSVLLRLTGRKWGRASRARSPKSFRTHMTQLKRDHLND